MDVCFVVSTCIRKLQHGGDILNCIQSIRRFHGADAEIVVVCDGTPCAEASDDVSAAKAKATYWVPNPVPGSGEYGALHVVAQHAQRCRAPYMAYIHDSVTLQRAIRAEDMPAAHRGWVPLWYAGAQHMGYSPYEGLVETLKARLRADASSGVDAWAAAATDPRRMYVAFGCMGIGTPAAWTALWNTGLWHLGDQIRTREDRCRMERVVPYAACVAGVGPDVYPMTAALCGDIFAHPNAFTEHKVRSWRDDAVAATSPALWKTWRGR